MKALTLRWVDKFLIQLSIKEKFLILFWLPIIAILGITLYSVQYEPSQADPDL